MQPDPRRIAGCDEAPTALFGLFLVQLGLTERAGRLQVHAPQAEPDAWSEPGVVHVCPSAPTDRFWREDGLGRVILAHEAVHLAQFAA